ncbi:MAG: hypothetical protein ACLSFT_02565 [Ruminococcus callidus]
MHSPIPIWTAKDYGSTDYDRVSKPTPTITFPATSTPFSELNELDDDSEATDLTSSLLTRTVHPGTAASATTTRAASTIAPDHHL